MCVHLCVWGVLTPGHPHSLLIRSCNVCSFDVKFVVVLYYFIIKRISKFEPRRFKSNNVTFWHESTQTSLCSLILSFETPNDVRSVSSLIFIEYSSDYQRLWSDCAVCAGWSAPLLIAPTTLLEISCRGSLMLIWLFVLIICVCDSYTMVCPPVRGDNPLASGLLRPMNV